MSIWTYVIGFDISCREELVKDIKEKSESKFLMCLRSAESPYQQRTMAAFIHAEICNNYRIGQDLFLEFGFHRVYSSLLSDPTVIMHTHLKKWIVLSLAKLCEDHIEAKSQCIRCDVHLSLYPLLQDSHPAVRIATIYALGHLIGASLIVCPTPLDPGAILTSQQNTMRGKEIEIIMQILESCSDGCAAVRREAIIAASKLFSLPIHFENLSHIGNIVDSLSGDRQASAPHDDLATPSTSPARPTSKKFKKGMTTPTRSRPANPSSPDQNLSSWMMSSSQYSDMTQRLQKFLESRQSDALSQSSQPSASLFHNDSTSDSLAPPSLYFQHISPQSSPAGNTGNNNCYNSSLVLASSYLQLWFTLLETQWTDPHPLVSKAAKYILGYVKIVEVCSSLRH
jgi:hypothetical protein